MLARDEDAKGQWRHTQVTRPMWFPSSRACSACGRVNPKLKRERTWTCPNCGTRHDRNLTRCHQPEEPDHARRPKPGWAGSGGNGSTGAPASRWGHLGSGHRSPVAGPARDLPERERAHCPLSGPAENSGTTDDRSPNAGIIPINPPAQRRMGAKLRPVEQDLWFNAGVIVVPARFSCCLTLHICDTGTAKFDR